MPDAELDPIIRRKKFLAQRMISSSVKIMPSAPLAKDPRPPRPRSRGSMGLARRDTLQGLSSPFSALAAVNAHVNRGEEPQDVLESLKAIARLKPMLRRRFSNVYEAYTYCDQTGCG
jgi:hypothetical protein